MTSYRLIESFDIDDGSLNQLTRQECFALGVEWEIFFRRVQAGENFSTLCLAANAERLVALAERQGRFVEHHSHCQGWFRIIVGGNRS